MLTNPNQSSKCEISFARHDHILSIMLYFHCELIEIVINVELKKNKQHTWTRIQETEIQEYLIILL
jgi:hypothetical protein